MFIVRWILCNKFLVNLQDHFWNLKMVWTLMLNNIFNVVEYFWFFFLCQRSVKSYSGNTLINFIIQRSHSIINVMIFRTFKHWYRVEEESVSLDAPVTTLDIPQERNYPVSINSVLFNLSKWLSSTASKPVNIRWIWTGSQPYWKIMYSIVLQAISTNMK